MPESETMIERQLAALADGTIEYAHVTVPGGAVLFDSEQAGGTA